MNKLDALNVLIEAQEDIIRQLRFDCINNKDNNIMSLYDVQELEKKIRDIKNMLPASDNKDNNKNLPKIRFENIYFTLEQPYDNNSSYILWAYNYCNEEGTLPECGIEYKLEDNPSIDLVYSRMDDKYKDRINLYMYEDPYLEAYTYKSFIDKESIKDVFEDIKEENKRVEAAINNNNDSENNDNNNDGGDDNDNNSDVYYIQL